jgi:putative FmdB family regulatory protein
MPFYEHKCPHHGKFLDRSQHESPCPECGSSTRRVFSFSIGPSFHEGYSPTTGGYVSNERDLSDQLKLKSEEATNRNGIEHRYVPVDLRDKEACGVSDEHQELIKERNANLPMLRRKMAEVDEIKKNKKVEVNVTPEF